jgi:hypothetical protein
VAATPPDEQAGQVVRGGGRRLAVGDQPAPGGERRRGERVALAGRGYALQEGGLVARLVLRAEHAVLAQHGEQLARHGGGEARQPAPPPPPPIWRGCPGWQIRWRARLRWGSRATQPRICVSSPRMTSEAPVGPGQDTLARCESGRHRDQSRRQVVQTRRAAIVGRDRPAQVRTRSSRTGSRAALGLQRGPDLVVEAPGRRPPAAAGRRPAGNSWCRTTAPSRPASRRAGSWCPSRRPEGRAHAPSVRLT